MQASNWIQYQERFETRQRQIFRYNLCNIKDVHAGCQLCMKRAKRGSYSLALLLLDSKGILYGGHTIALRVFLLRLIIINLVVWNEA